MGAKRVVNADGLKVYHYKGYEITNHGYYPPDKCIWWEAVNLTTGWAELHGNTKRELLNLIDKFGTQDKQETS